MTESIYAEKRRLHPMTLLYRAIANMPGLAIPIYFAFFQNDREEMFYLAITILIAMIIFPSIILNYLYFSFYISDKEIIIKSGVLSRKQRNIPIRRIQNVEIEQNFLQRLFGIAKVRIETAGDLQTEGNLEFVSKKNAFDIKEMIRTFQSETKTEMPLYDNDTAESEEETNEPKLTHDIPTVPAANYNEERQLLKLSNKMLFYLGMLSFSPLGFWLGAIVFNYLYIYSPEYYKNVMNYSTNISSLDTVLLVAAAFVVVMFFSWIGTIFIKFNKYYGFTLTRDDSKLYVQHGLLGKKSGAIPLRKLQYISIATNLLKRKFGFYSLELQTAGLGENRTAEIAVPIEKRDLIISLSRSLKNYEYPTEFKSVSRKTIRRAFFRYSIFYALLLLSFAIAEVFAYWLLAVFPVLYFAAYIRWKYRGYYVLDKYVLIKQGFLLEKTTVIPLDKIQTLNIRETFFQRKLHLSSLNIDTAGISTYRDATIIDIDRQEAMELLDIINTAFRKTISG